MAHPSTNSFSFMVRASMLKADSTTLSEFTVLRGRRDGVEGKL